MLIASDAVKVRVISSPALANVLLSLLELIDTPLKVGADVSVVTLPLPLVTAEPALPAVSLKAIL